jgi:peroxin-1
MKFKSVYDNAPMTLPTGILLYGPPGNGKSFIVPLLAKKARLALMKS